MRKLFLCQRIFLGDDDSFIDGGIVVKDGKIVAVLKSPEEVEQYKTQHHVGEEISFGERILMPGLIDAHVHINEPGRTDWEGFETATKAAAAGGFTTIVDMPLNSNPPTTTVENLHAKIQAAEGKTYVDVVPWGGVLPTNIGNILGLVDMGVRGFKCFLCPSGIDEFPHVTREYVESALEILENTGSVLAFHAELEPETPPDIDKSHPEKFETYLKSRPTSMELNAVSLVSEMALKYKDARLHIVHLSAAESIPLIQECRAKGGNLTFETCHHYLHLNAEDVPDYHTEFKCAPPVRTKENQTKLWLAVQEGLIDLLASDHSPCIPELKLFGEAEGQGDFLKAWGGIASNQFGLSLFWTKCEEYSLGLKDVYKLMCLNPAKHIGVSNFKGKIAEGYDADFCIWNPDEEFIVTPQVIQFKNKVTPYMNTKLRGVVHATYLRGEEVYSKSRGVQEQLGKILLK